MSKKFSETKPVKLDFNSDITFGKLNGCTVMEALDAGEHSYLAWLIVNADTKFSDPVVKQIIAGLLNNTQKQNKPNTSEYKVNRYRPYSEFSDIEDDIPF